MLFSFLPLPSILAAIGPAVHAIPFPLIVDELALINAPVFPGERANTTHLVVLPLARVSASVGVDKDTVAVNII